MRVQPNVRATVIDRDGGKCVACGNYCLASVHSVHHRRTTGMGGSSLEDTNQPQNLALLCGDGVAGCHGRATRERQWGELYGYRVPQGGDPALFPMRVAGRGWVLLEPDGTYLDVSDDGGDPS